MGLKGLLSLHLFLMTMFFKLWSNPLFSPIQPWTFLFCSEPCNLLYSLGVPWWILEGQKLKWNTTFEKHNSYKKQASPVNVALNYSDLPSKEQMDGIYWKAFDTFCWEYKLHGKTS